MTERYDKNDIWSACFEMKIQKGCTPETAKEWADELLLVLMIRQAENRNAVIREEVIL